jgi:hypothetical protein
MSVKNTTAASTPRVSGGRLIRAMAGGERAAGRGGEEEERRVGPGDSRRVVEVERVKEGSWQGSATLGRRSVGTSSSAQCTVLER